MSHNLATKQEQSRQREDVLQEKREEILRLRKERDELQAKIRRQEEEVSAASFAYGWR